MDVTNELTIVIPVRIDCRERKENLDTVIRFFLNETSANIIVLEADKEQRYQNPISDNRLLIHFVKDNDSIFYRTRYLNQLLEMSKTDIVGIWDTDVLIHVNQITQAIEFIKNGNTMCFPYDGRFFFLNESESHELRKEDINFNDELRTVNKGASLMGRPSVGGAFLVNKERYILLGGENEGFYGWGQEDAERVKRMEILEEPIQRIDGGLFHLYHPRGINSCAMPGALEKNNIQELIDVCKMNKEQLAAYINSTQWNNEKGRIQVNNCDAQPLVSVIMPVYNSEKYVSWAIESILQQSYQNFEFIIINDGSTDATVEQIEKFDDQRIRFINHSENSGNYKRRNEGMALSKGKYICVMDADDEALPFRLAVQVGFLEKHQSVLAVGSQFEFIGKGISNKPMEYESIKVKLLYNNMFLHPSLLIRKSVITELGGYNEAYCYSSDYDLACQIAMKGEIVNMPDVLMRYRIHESQISTAKHTEQRKYADMIRANYLKGIGFLLEDREFELLNCFMNREEINDKEELAVALDKIVMQNKKLAFLEEESINYLLDYKL